MISKASNSKSRVTQEFNTGDFNYIYRVPRQRQTKIRSPNYAGNANNKSYWIGPDTIIVPEGGCLWVSIFGELWGVVRK